MTISAPPAARRAFWVASILGALFLASAFFAPVPGVFHAALLFAAAWGIRRGQAWAAIAGASFLVIPFGLAVFPAYSAGAAGRPELGIIAAIVLFCAWALLRGARQLGVVASVRGMPWAVLVLAATAVWTMMRPFVIPTTGMAGTLLPGDHVLIETAGQLLGRLPQRGDIVAFRYPVDPKQFFLKRVVAVPGDRLRITNKRLYLNGAEVAEPWASHNTDYMDMYRDNFPSAPNAVLPTQAEEMLRHHVRNGEVVVPGGRYFVMGDNRDNSLDSRYWGFITRDDVIGRAVLIYGSYDRGTEEPSKVETAFNTRWSRLLKRPS